MNTVAVLESGMLGMEDPHSLDVRGSSWSLSPSNIWWLEILHMNHCITSVHTMPKINVHYSYKDWSTILKKYPPWINHGGPEMKCTCFYRSCWRKITQNDRSHGMDISRITKVILKNCKKNRKNDQFNLKNWIFKKIQKSSNFYGTRFTQPKYHNPRWKTVTRSLKPKIY